MSLEGGNRPEKRKRPGALEAGLSALAILGAVDQGPAYALDMPPEISWTNGIKKVRDAVINQKHESQTAFISFAGGRDRWPAVNEGTERNVVYTIEKEFNYVAANFRGTQIDVRCSIHTHPLLGHMATKPSGETITFPFSPPSDQDVKGAKTDRDYERFYAMLGMKVLRNVFANADTRGIWYYGPAASVEISQKQRDAWYAEFNEFGHKSLDTNFNFAAAFTQLQNAYRTHLGAEIRFVPYEQIAKEPKCAGVDYKPGTSQPNYEVKVNQPKTAPQPAPENKKPILTPKITPQIKGPGIEVRPELQIQLRDGAPTRPSLKDLNEPQTRPSLPIQGPPRNNVGRPRL